MSPLLVERLVISLFFGLSGLAKLAALEFEVEAFARWGFPPGSMYFIGILELLAATGIWIDRMSAFVALCLSGLAGGGLGVQIFHAEWPGSAITAVAFLLVTHYTWRQRDELFPSDRENREPPDLK